MAKVLLITNNTQSPVGIGQLNLTIEPGQSEAVTAAAWALAAKHQVVAYWLKTEALTVAEGEADAETAEAIEAAEAEPVVVPPPAIPTPGGKGK